MLQINKNIEGLNNGTWTFDGHITRDGVRIISRDVTIVVFLYEYEHGVTCMRNTETHKYSIETLKYAVVTVT